MALFRKISEQKELDTKKPTTKTPEGESEYLALPEIKTVLLKDIFSDIVLFLYTENDVKEPIFKFATGSRDQKRRAQFFLVFTIHGAEIFFKRGPEKRTLHLPDKKKRGTYTSARSWRSAPNRYGIPKRRNLCRSLSISPKRKIQKILSLLRNLFFQKKSKEFPYQELLQSISV